MSHNKDITVLICTRNCSLKILRCLDALASQKDTGGVSWELIIADFNSSEDMLESIRSYWRDNARSVPLKVLQILEEGKTPALRAGFANATGLGICIVDDDNIVDQKYLSTAFGLLMTHEEIGVIGARGELLLDDDVPVPEWFPAFEKMYAVGEQFTERGFVADGPAFFWGAGSVFRRSAYEAAADIGFVPFLNPTRGDGNNFFKDGFTGGEDPEMCFAVVLAGYRLWYEPSLTYGHSIQGVRLTEKFLLDMVKGSALPSPYLRLFYTFIKTNAPTGFKNFVRVVLWRSMVLQILYIICSFLLRFLLLFKNRRHLRLRFGVLKLRTFYELLGVLKLATQSKMLKNYFAKMGKKDLLLRQRRKTK